MSSSERLRSARDDLGGLRGTAYSLFKQSQTDKHVKLWQPTGQIETSNGLPSTTDGFKQQVTTYLELAFSETCHLAAAPEWAYDIEWVVEHGEFFFGADSPLFVLGCSPVSLTVIGDTLETIEEEGIDVYHEGVPDEPTKEFVTPTIVPIKPTARSGSNNPALLVQYKNQPMGEGLGQDEHERLACGSEVWKIDPPNGPGLAVMTCSEAMNDNLCHEITQYARESNMVMHVQCNPSPFNHSWTALRNDLFNGDDNVAYFCVNWGSFTNEGQTTECGYSGAYIKGESESSLGQYDQTYKNGGLQGTKLEYHFEYIWMMTSDAVSRFSFRRKNPRTDRSGQAHTANPQISTTWTWNTGEFTQDTPGIEESDEPECEQWQTMFPDSPCAAEVLAAISFAEIHPSQELAWASLSSLHAGNKEQLGHFLASYDHRESPHGTPGETAAKLKGLFDFVSNEASVVPDRSFEHAKAPINGTYLDKKVDACISLLESSANEAETKRAKWLVEWRRQTNVPFRPLVVTNEIGATTLQTLKDVEDPTKVISNPEEVDVSAGLVEVEE